MINLRNVYGDKIFNRKIAYRKSQYIPFIANLILDAIVAIFIIWIFGINWEYAFLKVFGTLQIYGVLKLIYEFLFDFINYRLFLKKAIASEIRHYLGVFNINLNWNEVDTYDDLLLESAFNEKLPLELRILAGINYGTVIDAMSMSRKYENRCFKLFCDIAPDFRRNDARYPN